MHAFAIGSGLLLAFALPPWGWWPLLFVGLVGLERLIADQPGWVRFARGFTVGLGWFFPSIVWMRALTLPGYVIASVGYSLMLGVAVALTPPDRRRLVALPGALVVMELVRWQWPFGGVPLSNFAVSQVSGPLSPALRIGGSILVVFLATSAAMAIAGALRRDRLALVPAATVVVAVLLGLVAPRGSAFDTIDVALVQGGGPQGTRADETDPRDVIERHLAASELVDGPVDLVLWPEDVVDVDRLAGSRENRELSELAQSLDTTLVAGIIEDEGSDKFRNAAVVYSPDGEIIDRFEKVERVPFGEWVPLRPILEPFAGDALPARDAIEGEGPAIIETGVGTFGVAISWEIFFGARVRDAIGNGGEILLNPTNGSSFEGTIVQTQQIASSRVRAIETGRWVLQAAPTGFTAVISPDGDVMQRTAVSEQAVLRATVERRSGLTWANRLGVWPATLLALVALGWGWWPHRSGLIGAIRSRRSRSPDRR